ncbi:MAG: hypothetical protein KatS3mg060_0495 [Dehalococcoidia bacterium]|nr:MAG: hypothetical protein KatS3mg060_0495 [Dehalococcoidia bacterium]
MEAIRAVRNVRTEEKVEAKRWIPATFVAGDRAGMYAAKASAIRQLARIDPLTIVETLSEPPPGCDRAHPRRGAPRSTCRAKGSSTSKRRKHASARRRAKAEDEVARVRARLANEQFLAKAPEAVVAKERDKLAAAEARLAKIAERLAAFS